MQNATYFKLGKIDLINCHLMLNKRIWVAYTLFEGFLANFLRVHSTPFFFFFRQSGGYLYGPCTPNYIILLLTQESS